jgi:hypothetical protein
MSATTLVGDLINWSKCKTSDGKESLHSPVKTAAIDLGIDPMGYSEECDIADLVFEEIVERIEREYLPRPVFEDGEPIQFGDLVDCGGSKVEVDDFIIGDGIKIFGTNGFITHSHRFREPFKRYVEPDTQEKINKDAVSLTCLYWGDKKPEMCKKVTSCGECRYQMVLDLLKRQRKLDGVE